MSNLSLLVAIFFCVLLLKCSTAGLTVVVINLIVGIVICSVRLWAACLGPFHVAEIELSITEQPHVTVIVPAHNEPPGILIDTLNAMNQVEYSKFDVIVIDNNTVDGEVWKPVEKHCKELGKRFRFFHVENLKGFKAGAINFIWSELSKETTLVAVVDADYIVQPNFLTAAAAKFVSPEVGLVQFPQAYNNVNSENLALANEYEHFFSLYMNMANHLDCVPSTGTLSVFSRKAIEAINLFNPSCITEDAEIGFRLSQAGYHGVYVDEIVGRGSLPHDLDSFNAQRQRWACGNAQIFFHNLKQLLLGSKFTIAQKFGIISQLTAWSTVLFVPTCAMVILPLVGCIEKLSPTQIAVLQIAQFTAIIEIVSQLIIFKISLSKRNLNNAEVFSAFIVHMSVTWLLASAWIQALTTKTVEFVRTNKFLLNRKTPAFSHGIAEAGAAIMLTTAAVLQLHEGQIFGAIVSSFLASTFAGYHELFFQLDATREILRSKTNMIEKR